VFPTKETTKRGKEKAKKHTFPRPLKKEPHNKHLQPRHPHHHHALHHAEIEDPRLGAFHGGRIAVLARAEVFLVAIDGGEVPRDFEDGFFEDGGLGWAGPALGGEEGGGGVVLEQR